MAQTTGGFLVERPGEWGLRRVDGCPGDGIDGIMGTLDRAGDGIDLVQVRHEEMAAFMACAHAELTGGAGACRDTSDPGAIHLLNRFYDAKLDRPPLVAWDEAFADDRPCVIDFVVDPEVPPLPPHITLEHAKNFSAALLRDPSRMATPRQSMKEAIDCRGNR